LGEVILYGNNFWWEMSAKETVQMSELLFYRYLVGKYKKKPSKFPKIKAVPTQYHFEMKYYNSKRLSASRSRKSTSYG